MMSAGLRKGDTALTTTRTVTLLHGADLHLGAPMRGVTALPAQWQQRVLDAMDQAFIRLVDVALRHSVDFVVLAGDLFDQARPSLHDLSAMVAQLERLAAAEIPVYVCGGNHDPFTVWQQENFAALMPDNVFIFDADRPSYFLYERDGEPLCILAGRSYYAKIWPADTPIAQGITRARAVDVLGEAAQAAPFGVGVLHTGLDLDRVKAPSGRKELASAGFDYWALGHLHRRLVDTVDGTTLAFSGCIQGRDLRETGRRGVNLVTLTEGTPAEVRFVPTASIALARVVVDVSLDTTLSQVKDRIMAALFAEDGNALCEMMVSRVYLEGATDLHRELSDEETREALRHKLNDSYDDFYCDEIIDQTTDPATDGLVETLRWAEEREFGHEREANDPNFAGTERPLTVDLASAERAERQARGRFPELLIRTAEDQYRDGKGEAAYLQAQFSRYGLELDAADAKMVDRLSREARQLNLDLLGISEGADS